MTQKIGFNIEEFDKNITNDSDISDDESYKPRYTRPEKVARGIRQIVKLAYRHLKHKRNKDEVQRYS